MCGMCTCTQYKFYTYDILNAYIENICIDYIHLIHEPYIHYDIWNTYMYTYTKYKILHNSWLMKTFSQQTLS